MNALKVIVLFFLVACAYAVSEETAETMPVTDRMRRCGRLTFRSTSTTINCNRGRNMNRPGRTSTITATIIIGNTRQITTIKTPCNRPKFDRMIVPRVTRCLRVLLPRCRCLRPSRRAFCIAEQTEICAGRNDASFLTAVPTPEPEE